MNPQPSPLQQLVWTALERGEIDPMVAIDRLEAGLPGGVAALVPFTRHPLTAVRRAASGALERHRDPPPLVFTLLGGFSVTRGTWRADDVAWDRRVAQRVVRFLVLRRGVVSEDEILEAFWPDRTVDCGRHSMHVAVSKARAVLDSPRVPSVIETGDRTYRLRLRAGDVVDADEFEATAQAALTARGAERAPRLERAAALWGGEPLPEERYADWALGWRERLTDLYAAVLAAQTDDCLAHGDPTAAELHARDLVELDPLNEGAHRRLMLAYARGGRRNRALRQFLECRRALVENLGVEPAVETQRLQQRVLAGDRV